MNEETILKRSLFGGYKKGEVIQYMDSVTEGSEKKIAELEARIAALLKENKALSSRANASSQSAPTVHDAKPDYSQSKGHASFASHLQNSEHSQESLSISQQMNLPEGSYQVSKDHRVISLPDPQPMYQTAGSTAIISEPSTEAHMDSKPEQTPETPQPISEEKVHPQDRMPSPEAKNVNTGHLAGDPYNSVHPDDSQIMISHPVGDSTSFATHQRVAEREDMQHKLNALMEELAKERQEKQALAAKLDFCNSLLVQLYKS